MEEITYLPDAVYQGFRYQYAVGVLKEILTTPGHKDEAIVSQLMAAVDERLGTIELVFPDSVKDSEPPPGYFNVDESAFERVAG